MTNSDPILPVRVADLVVKRGERTIIDHLSLNVGAGEIYALLGGNGAGKSTTLATLLGFLKPVSGSVRIDGIDPGEAPDAARRRIAFLPENVALYDHLTARENIDYFLALAGDPRSTAEKEAAFDAAGLQVEARGRRVSGFSKGMRQKVAIALAVVRQVPLLLLDEPTSGLDPRATADFNALLRQLRERGTAILMVTHDLLGAADCADRIGFLDTGRIVEEVTSAEGYDVMALHRRYGEARAA
ncbi:ABC transporter ATP-binding protein [Sphingomonas sp. BGYR3]|uniref:ABC transporter ATP-binding protein n=1 Tax=Sphingomonas sp. BGYR3 TaxID=2975483 RepID=UPI0021A42190|nr:ABC transporter ATP-binding protein [Sphingomonas sp. BGYR3]MDG5488790.1 ABC transporter ATP-binding protein [Sphingomonas sp. BGYR3]